jgi:hypothetical protein
MKTQFFDKLINYVVASSLLYFFRLKRISPFFLISFENKFVNNAGNRSKRGCNLALNIGERECYVSFTQRGVKAEKLTKRNFFLQHIKRSNSPPPFSVSSLVFSTKCFPGCIVSLFVPKTECPICSFWLVLLSTPV